MKVRPYVRNPYKKTVLGVVRGTVIDTTTLHRAYRSLRPDDRDCLRYVPRLLALAG